MSLKFGNSNVTQVKFGPNTSNLSNVNKIIFNNAVAWCRPFILYISKDSGVSSVTVTRTKTEEPTANTNVSIADGGTVYFNDKISISASPRSGYKINSHDSSKIVTGDTLVNITSSPLYPVAPTISSVSTGGSPYSRTATFTLKNNNAYQSALYYEVSTSSGTIVGTGWTSGISSGGTTTVTKSLSSSGDYNIRVRAYSELRYSDGSNTTSEWSGYSTATYTRLELAEPIISNAHVNGAATGCWATIYNPNDVSVTVYVEVWSYRDDEIQVDTSFTLAAKTSVTKSFSYSSGINTSDMYFCIGFSALYYEPSEDAYADISYGGTEETTTTTR